MNGANRVAVLGLYRSGSTAVAGALHHLGVDMGAPFFEGYFESAELANALRCWWDEPRLRARVPQADRVAALSDWVRHRQQCGSDWLGAKHALLSLCGDDLLRAWGRDTRFIWSYRAFEQSVASLEQVGWWRGSEEVQRKLWTELHRFFSSQDHLRIDYAQMSADPRGQIERIIEFLDLQPSADQLSAALQFVVPNARAKVEREGRRDRLLAPLSYIRRRLFSAA